MKNPVTEKLIAAVQRRGAPGADEIAFLRDFYHRLSGQDFAVRKAAEFHDAALRQRQLAETRAPGQTLIEIYNLDGAAAGATKAAAADAKVAGKKSAAAADSSDAPALDDRNSTVISIITDDKPFIIDSLTIKLNALRKTLHRTVHPTFEVRRDANHRIIELSRYQGARPGATAEARGGQLESYIQFVIDFTPAAEHGRLRRALRDVMADIEIVVRDWSKMRGRALALAEKIEGRKQGPAFAEHGELLRWLENHNFAFLGYAEIEIAGEETPGRGKNKSAPTPSIVRQSVLGVLRAAHRRDPASAHAILPPPARSETSPVIFTKSRRRSAIHRANYLDCILIDHHFNRPAHGKRRVSCILGFLAGSSELLPTAAIPHLRNKTAYILKESTLRPGGYAYKSLHAILETLPRGKLFQMDTRSLYRLCMTVLNHLERRSARVHLHRNICGHFYSCLVYIPRDVFNSTLRQRIQEFLGQQLGADEVTFTAHFSDSILIRIHYLIHCTDAVARRVDAAQLQLAVQAMARDWNDNLFEAIRGRDGYAAAGRALALYRDAFPANYRDEFPVTQAVTDIGRFARAQPNRIYAVLTTRDRGDSGDSGDRDGGDKMAGRGQARSASFKLYLRDQSAALSDVLPILENMGVRVLGGRPYRIARQDGAACRLHDFEIVRHDGRDFDLDASPEISRHFEDGFIRAWDRRIENDGFNRLILLAGLDWQETRLLRAYYRYLKQIRLRYSEHYIIEALANHPQLVVSIVQWFHARFDPRRAKKTVGKNNNTVERKLQSRIAAQLEQVATLDEDRIIRALLDVIKATLRTNYYQRAPVDGAGDDANTVDAANTVEAGDADAAKVKPYLAFKLDSAAIPRIPKPAPAFEIFVFSPRVEGVHLRGGFVARGGLRWSERPEDFRTEVLGLVKAQRVKNAVIVPVGSKGGFVAKRLPAAAGRDAVQREVVACYRLFISGLLDLTDNLAGNRVLPPPDVVRFDADDPYLVVAADKGTATFSDIANEISAAYNFWLGDAFASGGSAGYDHKKMGITARGAWESVKRHFRELGKDIQRADFSVAGIGDMGGDVFGNGMLLSKHIRLIAAFNHRHIFIDPDPNAAASYRERQRLFNLPRSSWDDYNRKLLSAGGGVYARSAKSIELSKQARQVLGATRNQYAPDELINLILRAEVELLWNGGIGTYIKASDETHAQAQDKNNDGVRVDADQLRCKVVGEGGNLGMTQLARIEFCMRGGLCYTDAIDNSAGVDTSDHEVNIKILLNAAMRGKQLQPEQRNRLLAGMQSQVGEMVLANNYAQAQTLSLEAARGAQAMPQQARAIAALEAGGQLDRAIEFLPEAAAIDERIESGRHFTRPELAVLLSYSKMDLARRLLDSDALDDGYLAAEIDRYFPPRLTRRFPRLVRSHRLRREIIATQITNDLVSVMGPTFHLRMAMLTAATAADITRAYIAARDLLDAPKLRAAIEKLDNQVDARVQMEMLEATAAAVEVCVAGLLRARAGGGHLNIRRLVAAIGPTRRRLQSRLAAALGPNARAQMQKRMAALTAKRVPAAVATPVAQLPWLGYAADITVLARNKGGAGIAALAARNKGGADNATVGARAGATVDATAAVYFRLREALGLDWLERAIDALPSADDWHARARFALAGDLRASHLALATRALTAGRHAAPDARITAWLDANREAVAALKNMTAAMQSEPAPDFAMLSVLIAELPRLH